MKKIRSEVCKRANALVKQWNYSKTAAFKQAWAEVKALANTVKASDLAIGQTIRIEYGYDGNFVTCTVTDISKELFLGKYYTIKAVSVYGSKIEFCAEPEEMIDKAA